MNSYYITTVVKTNNVTNSLAINCDAGHMLNIDLIHDDSIPDDMSMFNVLKRIYKPKNAYIDSDYYTLLVPTYAKVPSRPFFSDDIDNTVLYSIAWFFETESLVDCIIDHKKRDIEEILSRVEKNPQDVSNIFATVYLDLLMLMNLIKDSTQLTPFEKVIQLLNFASKQSILDRIDNL